MNEMMLEEVVTGVLKIDSQVSGPEEVNYEGATYFRFMDYFYIKNKNLDELEPEEVSNLCRARAKYPDLISPVNREVRGLFKELVEKIQPSSLLEIGAGRDPVFGLADGTPINYILADADLEVVAHHRKLNNKCYEFSRDICDLPGSDDLFEMAIAVFVFHFPFHGNQLLQLHNRLAKSGVIVANVYRRSQVSRDKLTQEIMELGFKIVKVPDGKNLCKDHEYWILGKNYFNIEKCAAILKYIIS